MTKVEAEAEAKRRWGASGEIRHRAAPNQGREGKPGRLARYRYLVGNGELGSGCTVLGQGDSWAEAFADVRPRPKPGHGGDR